MTRYVRLLVASLTVVTLVAAGCSWQGGSGSSSPASVRWTITYPVGSYARNRTAAAACPADATCHTTHDRSVTFVGGRHAWITVANRTLTCPDALGRYPDPNRACEAVGRLRAILREKVTTVCSCPAELWPAARATATISGKTVTVPLSYCPYCGRSTRTTQADIAYLTLQHH